jgi:beta-N-acetylhexosaminidase
MMTVLRYITIWTIYGAILLSSGTAIAPGKIFAVAKPAPEDEATKYAWIEANNWADSVYNELSDRARIGQLFMIRAHSNLGEKHIKSVEDQIKQYEVGGLCFFQGTPEKQAQLTNQYQSLSKLPLFISIDAEWGLGMRFKENIIDYPRNLMIGAIDDNTKVYQFSRAIGRQLKRIGVHINFGPVVDINNNPKNPVINDRSFGENKYNVVTKSFLYMIGLEDEGVMACAKHFPGHGDTQVDSHYDLPIIGHSIKRLEEFELFPFQMLADNGLRSMMIAHVHMPSLDSTPNLPATLSPAIVDTLLKQKMGYSGLIFTDALEMKGVTKHFAPGDIEVRAFLAGNDMLLLPSDMDKAFAALESLVQTDEFARMRLEESVKKILIQKYMMGLHNQSPVELDGLITDIQREEDISLKEDLIANAITLLDDPKQKIPFKDTYAKSLGLVILGGNKDSALKDHFTFYADCTPLHVSLSPDPTDKKAIEAFVASKDEVIFALYPASRLPNKQFGMNNTMLSWVDSLRLHHSNTLMLFGNPYTLQYFTPQRGPIIMAYENDIMIERIAVEGYFGAYSFSGKLPVTAGSFKFGEGKTSSIIKGQLTLAKEMDARKRKDLESKYDEIMKEMISLEAAPGGQLLILKDNALYFQKSYGTTTYQSNVPVSNNHLYDLASITKIAAGTLAMMKLYDQGKISLSDTIGKFLPALAGSNKGSLRIDEVMAHRSGLHPWIPFYKETVKGSGAALVLDPEIYSRSFQKGYLQIADSLFIHPAHHHKMWQAIASSPLSNEKKYVYSDLGFIMITEIVRSVSGRSLDDFVAHHFYEPMGLRRILYNPLHKFAKTAIVPTEIDDYFRGQLLQGYVHDMGAAMLGGVSGHAGLFANAADLAKLLYMLTSDGVYLGRRYLSAETVRIFTTRFQDDTRRGIGFDMHELRLSQGLNMTALASASTFGHMGFTGTCVWADPECGIIFVFLSNRVHPKMDNPKLSKYQYRRRTHHEVYHNIYGELQ